MKMKVRKNIRSLPNHQNITINQAMVDLEGKFVYMEKSSTRGLLRGPKGLWDIAWLEPLTKNEEYLEKYKQQFEEELPF